VSQNGRYVTFASDAPNLVMQDLNSTTDVFVRDLAANSIERVSVDGGGLEANGASSSPAISTDGRFVVFASEADNLVAGDSNGVADIFVHDRQTAATTRVSLDSVGAEANGACAHPGISADGSFVVFSSLATNLVAADSNGFEDVFLRDCVTGTTSALSTSAAQPSDGPSRDPVISASADCIAFVSFATNLVAADTDATADILLYDRPGQQLELTSKNSVGIKANNDCSFPDLSADGSLVAFSSAATNLVPGDSNGAIDVFQHERSNGQTSCLSVDAFGVLGNAESIAPSLSEDGRWITFQSSASNLVSDDTNGSSDIFLVDTSNGLPQRISVSSSGEGDQDSLLPVISGDGRAVTYVSQATNLFPGDSNGLPDVLAYRDLVVPEVRRTSISSAGSEGNQHSNVGTRVSADGRYVLFGSWASNLVTHDTNGVSDMFLYDLQKSKITRISVDSAGAEGNGNCHDPAMSADGGTLAFASSASNLVAGDTNGDLDVFVHELESGITTRVSVGSLGEQGDDDSRGPWLSADGRYVAFYSLASTLVAGDTNDKYDVFLHDRVTGVTTRESLAPGNQQLFLDSIEPSLSADGQMLAFESLGAILVPGDTNLASDCFVKNLQTGAFTAVSMDSAGTLGNQKSDDVVISADGSFCVFESNATNLVPGDTNNATDIFGYDLATGSTTRLSVDSFGHQSNGLSDDAYQVDGRNVVFRSQATNLVDNDTNLVLDVFLHDRLTGITERVSVDPAGVEGNDVSEYCSVSADGTVIAMRSLASNLVPGDTNGVRDTFVRVRSETNFLNFGQGLAGSGGLEPQLTGTPAPGTQFTLQISQGLGGALSFLIVGSGRAQGTLFGGDSYINFARFWVMVPLGLSGPLGVPGVGSVQLTGRHRIGPLAIHFQAAIIDAAAPQGFALTPGLLLQTQY
jgi:Tol biopolymer transport system component